MTKSEFYYDLFSIWLIIVVVSVFVLAFLVDRVISRICSVYIILFLAFVLITFRLLFQHEYDKEMKIFRPVQTKIKEPTSGSSLIKNVNSCIERLFDEFRKDPFSFYGESDLQNRLGEIWSEKTKQPTAVYREVPTEKRYRINDEVLTKDYSGSRAHIDLVFLKNNEAVGIEMFVGTESDDVWYTYEKNPEMGRHLKRRTISVKQAIKHAERDRIKLMGNVILNLEAQNKFVLTHRILLIFFRAAWRYRTHGRMDRKEVSYKSKISRIKNHIKDFRKERVKVYYCIVPTKKIYTQY